MRLTTAAVVASSSSSSPDFWRRCSPYAIPSVLARACVRVVQPRARSGEVWRIEAEQAPAAGVDVLARALARVANPGWSPNQRRRMTTMMDAYGMV
jgi:hypothetical protein